MSRPGTDENPLRVAIIGAGPSGFYVAEHLLNRDDLVIELDMIERLPTPYGLVRGGVAPDHQKIKSVAAIYDKTAAHPHFRFYGNVEFGTHVTLEDLQRFYHQIVFTTGAQTDRRMGIPGEDLVGSHPATAFVAWYNGHPDFCDLQFDLSHQRAVVVGVGNVAVDVARILCRTDAELAKTDIADYALEALSRSQIQEVVMLGRRGPAQAAFSNPELKELGELAGADLVVRSEDVTLDDLSLSMLERNKDRAASKKIQMLQDYARRSSSGEFRRLILRFLVSPVELFGNVDGRLTSMRLVKNELYATEAGTLRPRATDDIEEMSVGLVFRSVGYQGVPLPDLPFDERWGVILNQKGRVLNPETSQPKPGQYTSGWIKRGPTGVIGTNKSDALETVRCMVEDIHDDVYLHPSQPEADAADNVIRHRQRDVVTYTDWLRLNHIEIAKGQALGKPRVKFTRIEDMLAVLKEHSLA
ncbi:MAG: FAD-dependent oxidoreductase [Candidatus Tectomicrobia bacterium]